MAMLEEIIKELKDADINIKDTDIQIRIDKLTKFNVPEKEIKRSILVFYGVSTKNTGQGDNPIGPVANVISDGMWTSLQIKVVQLWENNHESIDQTGIVGDASGTVKFTKWASAKLQPLEEGKCYLLLNVVSSVYNEKMQVSLNKRSKIETTDDDVEVKDNTIAFIGAFVSMQSNSGLITRCDKCNKAIRGSCQEHPDAEGHYDLRIMGTVDNGVSCSTVILNAEIVESLTGFTVESSREMAATELDKEVVGDALEKLLLGKFFYVSGSDMDGTILAKAMMPYVKSISDGDLKELIKYIGK